MRLLEKRLRGYRDFGYARGHDLTVWYDREVDDGDLARSGRSMKRPRLFVAGSYDAGAKTGVLVVDLRGNPPRTWERVVHESPKPAALIDFALTIARLEQLRDFDLFLTARVDPLAEDIAREFGHLRVRWVARRKNLPARKRALAALRTLVPRPRADDDQYSLAEYGVDLEIAAFAEAAVLEDAADEPPF